MFLLAVIFCSFTASAVVSPPSAYCAVRFGLRVSYSSDVVIWVLVLHLSSKFTFRWRLFLSLLFLLLLYPATRSTPPVTVLSQLSNLLCPCLCVSVWQMATFACIMQKSANGTNVSLGSGPRSAIISYAGKCPAWLFSGEQRRCRREATRRWRMHN